MAIRVLIALFIAQTLGVFFLVRSLDSLSARLDAFERGRPSGATKSRGSSYTQNPQVAAAGGGVSAAQIRYIVARELDKALSRSQGARTASADVQPDNDTAQTVAIDPQLTAFVTKEIDRHISEGSISTVDMNRLQGDIARLDGPSRKTALKRLVQAMNSGSIKGRF
ncbi:MAG: hypothetical protein AAFN74_24100 [Myxococcota bacterium]